MSNKVKGFTLIEILIAIFISGLIFTMMIFGLKTMINQYHGLQKNQKNFKRLQMGEWQIQHDVEYVQPRKVTDESGNLQAVFLGKNDAMEFTTQQGKIIRRAYFFDKDNHTIVSRTWKVLDRVKPSDYSDQILFDHVNNFSLQYFDDKKNLSPLWPENLETTAQPPQSQSPQVPQVQQESDYPLAIIMTIDLDKIGSMTHYFLIKKSA